MREEVEWNFVAYEDNQPVLDLIAKRPVCILGLLDEGCATGSGKDSSVLENYHSTFTQAKYKAYIKPKKSADRTFVLSHYAGEVVYTIEGWIEKNKDELSADITAMLEVTAPSATHALLLPGQPPATSPASSPASLTPRSPSPSLPRCTPSSRS